jgi:hypothetical protein
MEKLKKLADLLCWDCRYGKRNDGLFGGSCPGWRESDNECQAYQNLREIIAEPDVIVVDGVEWETVPPAFYSHLATEKDGLRVSVTKVKEGWSWSIYSMETGYQLDDGLGIEGTRNDAMESVLAATAVIKEAK